MCKSSQERLDVAKLCGLPNFYLNHAQFLHGYIHDILQLSIGKKYSCYILSKCLNRNANVGISILKKNMNQNWQMCYFTYWKYFHFAKTLDSSSILSGNILWNPQQLKISLSGSWEYLFAILKDILITAFELFHEQIVLICFSCSKSLIHSIPQY